MSSVNSHQWETAAGCWLMALVVASLGAAACNNNVFPSAIPPGGSSGSVGARGGSTGGAGTGGVAVIDPRTPLDGGSLAADGGPPAHCAPIAPTGPVIADFDSLTNQAFGRLGVDPVVGGTYVTPAVLLEDFSGSNWHLSGLVAGPVSFGLDWSCPAVADGVCTLDLSRYAGIQFTISGNLGGTEVGVSLALTMGTVRDEAPAIGLGCGTCSAQNVDVCTDPVARFGLGSGVNPPQIITIYWLGVQAGAPFPSMDPGRVTGIAWTLPAATDGSSYPVDFTVDDIRLLPIPR